MFEAIRKFLWEFPDKHPNFPLVIAIISLLLVIAEPILVGMLQ